MNEEEKNLKSVKGMTKWQRMRFEMLVSASGAFIRVVHLVVLVGIALIIAARMQSQTWYNWKNDERVAKLEEQVEFFRSAAVLHPTKEYNPHLLARGTDNEDVLGESHRARSKDEITMLAWLRGVYLASTFNNLRSDAVLNEKFAGYPVEAEPPEAPHKAMRHYWRTDEHPPIEDSGMAHLSDLITDEMLDKFFDWMWKSHPTEFFIGSFLILGTLLILLFEGPMALLKLLFGKTEEDKPDEDDKQGQGEPSDEDLSNIGMTRDEWNAQNLDNMMVPKSKEYEKVKKEAQEFKVPDIEEPKKD